MLPDVFPLISANAGVTSIIGTNPVRFYPHGDARQGTPAPYCSWFIVVGVTENCLGEVPRVDNYTIQIDCWSDNSGDGADQVQELAKAVRDALEPYMHMTGVVINGVDLDTRRHRIGMQFSIWQNRDPVS